MRYFAKAKDETEPGGNRLKTGLVNRATSVQGLLCLIVATSCFPFYS